MLLYSDFLLDENGQVSTLFLFGQSVFELYQNFMDMLTEAGIG
jgi:hypothetical protein